MYPIQLPKGITNFPVITIFIACLFLVFTWSNCTSGETELTSEVIPQDSTTVELPKQSIEVPLSKLKATTKFTLDPVRDTVLELGSGSSIKVAANSIVTMSGEPVKVPIQIQLNEVRKASEIILSGAPMRYYDENGEETWMETSGMFELTASAQGQALKIAEGKAIQVDFASATDQNVGFWHFDENLGNWINLDINPPIAKRLERKVEKTPASPTNRAIKAVLGNPKKILPPFKIDYRLFPSLKEFRNLEWEYAGKDPAKNPRNNPDFFNPWSNILINKKANNSYTLTFSRADEQLIVPVRPCFRRAKDLEAFNQSMAAYEGQQKEIAEQKKNIEQRNALAEQQLNFVRSAQIENFGIYNWDKLIKLDEAVQFASDFDFGTEIPEHLQGGINVFLITGEGGRSVVKFPRRDWSRFSFVPSMENKLIALLPDGKVAVFLQEDFEQEKAALQAASRGRYQFKMKVLPQKIETVKDLDKILS